MYNWFYKLNQTIENGDFNMFGIDFSWLKQHNKDTYCLMNIASYFPNCPQIPDGKELYILSWFFEPFVDVWFLEIFNRNPQAQFVVITDMNPNNLATLDRVKFFQIIHHQTWFEAIHLMNQRPKNLDLLTRKFKISSLSSRLNEFKFYITAKLHSKQHPEAFYTWNRGFDIKDKDGFIFEPHGFYHSDQLLYLIDFLKNNSINAENFKNNPLDGCYFTHPAYNNTVINSVNETLSLSQTPEFGKLPTPYITEKTWKPLFAGNAILFTGQAGLKKQLESWGFVFDYVWAQDYDDSFNDNQRLEVILSQINWILEIPVTDLAEMAQSSVEHNLELAWSGNLERQFSQHNLQTLQEIKDYVGL
jgi:hypothetical protein